MTTVQGKRHGGAIWWVRAAGMSVRMLVAIVAVIRGGGEAFSMPDSPAYVALAELLEAPLATLDERLVRTTGPRCEFLTYPGAGNSTRAPNDS